MSLTRGVQKGLPTLTVMLAAACCAVLWNGAPGYAEELPTVVVVNPQRGDVNEGITLPGSLEPYEKTALYARVSGYLEEIRVDIGDVVKKAGEVAKLAVPEMALDLTLAEADVAAAQARLQKAQADATLASITYNRLATLQDSEPGAITQQDVDVAAAQEKVAAAQIEIARADVQVARAKAARLETLISYATIRAPFDGIVTKRAADTGALISAGATDGEFIIEVARTDKLRLVINVPERVAPYVCQGQEVEFTLDAFPARHFSGTVSRLAGALMSDTRNMHVEIDVDNEDGTFYPGMFATVSFTFRDIPDVLTIPATTLRTLAGDPYVYSVDDGVIRRVPVSILLDDGAQVVVAGELDGDTQLVVASQALLAEGQKVQVRKERTTE